MRDCSNLDLNHQPLDSDCRCIQSQQRNERPKQESHATTRYRNRLLLTMCCCCCCFCFCFFVFVVFPLGVARFIIFYILLCVSMSPAVRPSFSYRNVDITSLTCPTVLISACCAREGETGTGDSESRLGRTDKWSFILSRAEVQPTEAAFYG